MANVALTPSTSIGVSDAQQGAKKRQIVQIARELNQIGWGNQGNITGMIEEVDIDKLWPNPMHPAEHTEEDIDDMKESLQVEGQKDPVVVAYAQAPDDSDGYSGCTLLIVDGHLRYYGRLRQGKDTIRVIVQPFTSLTQIMVDAAMRALHRRTPTPLETARYIMRIRLAHEVDKAQNPDTPPFPTLEELGRMVGRSKGTISTWLKLAMQSADFVALVDNGQVTLSQSMELLRLPDEAERLRQASLLAQQNETRQIPTPGVRGQVDAKRQRVPVDKDSTVPYSTLWAPRISDQTPTSIAMAYLGRDLNYLLMAQLDELKQAKQEPHPAITRLYRALSDPAIQDFIQEAMVD